MRFIEKGGTVPKTFCETVPLLDSQYIEDTDLRMWTALESNIPTGTIWYPFCDMHDHENSTFLLS